MAYIDTRMTGNNPADLGKLEAEFLRKTSRIDVGRGDDDLVLFPGTGGLNGRNPFEAGNTIGIDFDANFTCRGDVREIGGEPIRNINRRRRATRRQTDSSVDPRNRMSESRSISFRRLPPRSPRADRCGWTT